MAAIFGSPVSAVLLAIELLLFEFRPRSIIPVALASATAAGMRIIFEGGHAGVSDARCSGARHWRNGVLHFAWRVDGSGRGGSHAHRLFRRRRFRTFADPLDVVAGNRRAWRSGLSDISSPRTLGVGYDNITDILSNQLDASGRGDFVRDEIRLLDIRHLQRHFRRHDGAVVHDRRRTGAGRRLASQLPTMPSIDLKLAALVGMAAMFAGASRAFLASTVFAFEATLQPFSLLPLLGGCAASYLVAALLSKTSLMTEKIVRRGVAAPHEY